MRSLRLGRLGLDVLRSKRHPAGPGRDAARRLIAARMGHLRGLPQKIGQMLSLGELDVDAPLFTSLTDAAEQVPASESFAWIAGELGVPLARVFRHLDERGAAASLGQVHRGELLDGRQVAVKVQYAHVRESLDADLLALGWLAAPLSAKRSGFDLREYRNEMRRSLLLELDYAHEAATLRRFARRAIEVPGLVTPAPVDAWCTPRVVTMSWVDGERMPATRQWPDAARRDAALTLLRFFLRGCFVWRELHADPHAGNLRFARDGERARVGVLDFGCVKTLGAAESDGLRRLAQHGADLTSDELFETYVAIGFDSRLLEPMAGRLPAVTAVLFEPFHVRGTYDIRRWRLSERLAETLGDDRWNFRFAGPASLLFLVRAFQGLVQYARALEAVVDWRRELLALPQAAGGRSDRPSAVPSPHPTLPGGSNLMAATTLRLRVVRNGEPVVQLSLKASAVGHLPELVPEDLAERILRRGVDLARLAERAVADGYPVGDIFTLSDDDRTVRVWLE